METDKLSEKKFGELFLTAYKEISEDMPSSESGMSEFLEVLAFSLALTIDEKTGKRVSAQTLLDQLLTIYVSDEGPEITKDKEKFSLALLQRLKFLDILPFDKEPVSDTDAEPALKEIKDRFEAAHAALNGKSNHFPERVSIGGSNNITGLFKYTIATISDRLKIHGINLDRELLETFVSELIGQGHDINKSAGFISVLIQRLKERGIIKPNEKGKMILTSPPSSPEKWPKLTFDLFKTAYDKVNVIGSMTFIQDISAELAGLCGLDEASIKEAIMSALFELKETGGSGQQAHEIFRKEPELFYPLLMEELEKKQK